MATWNSKLLISLEEKLLERLEELFLCLGLDIDVNYEVFKGVCPIHADADNYTAFNFNVMKGRWRCYSKKCHEVFQSTIIGFVRAVLSSKKGWGKNGDEKISFDETLKYIQDFLDSKAKVFPKKNLIYVPKKVSFKAGTLTRDQVRKRIKVPSKYFIDRGFSEAILDQFDIGDCRTFGKRMSGRAIVPVYNFKWRVIGCSGRTIYEKCEDCGLFHRGICPDKKTQFLSAKWLHSRGFNRSHCLFNLQYASKFIRESKTIIVVEGPMNAVRLAEANINNAVALFGSSLTKGQKYLIDNSGAYNIVLLMDNDEAGRLGAKSILRRCYRSYNIIDLVPQTNDIAEMSINEIKSFVNPVLEKL